MQQRTTISFLSLQLIVLFNRAATKAIHLVRRYFLSLFYNLTRIWSRWQSLFLANPGDKIEMENGRFQRFQSEDFRKKKKQRTVEEIARNIN